MSELPLDLTPKPRRAVRKKPQLAVPVIDAVISESNSEVAPVAQLHSAKLDPLTLWFVGAVAVGTALHLLSAAPTPALRIIGWSAPLLISIAYPALGLTRGWHKSPASREKFADNSYYLGFIFTQVALVVGFVPMTLFNAELGSQDVLRAFSVALGASLIGLVVRTMLVQTGHSVTENADIVENEVENLAIAVSKQTQKIVNEFSRLGGRLTKTYADLNSELEHCVGRLAETFKNYEETVGRDVQTVSVVTADVVETSRQANASVQSGATAIAKQTARSAGLLDAARDKLRIDLEDAIRVLQQTNSALSLSANALTQAPDFGRAVGNLIDRVGDAESAVTRFEGVAHSSELAVQEAARGHVTALDEVANQRHGEFSQRAASLESDLGQATQSLESTLKAFREELRRISG